VLPDARSLNDLAALLDGSEAIAHLLLAEGARRIHIKL
jgi:hypothetical protein